MKTKVIGLFGAVVLVVMLVMSGCGPSAVKESAVPSEFVFYTITDLSGPLAPSNIGAATSGPLFCNWYNKKFGGIGGKVPLRAVIGDCRSDAAIGVSIYEDFRARTPKPIFIHSCPSMTAVAVKDRLNEDEIISLTQCPNKAVLFPMGYTIAQSFWYPVGATGMIDYVAEKWPGKTVRVGICTWDNAFGRGIITPEVEKFCKDLPNVELVGIEVFPATALDVTAQIERLKAAGANWILDNETGPGTVVVSKTIDAMGLLAHDFNDTTPGMMHRMSGSYGCDDSGIRLGGAKLMEGIISPNMSASWAEDVEGIRLIKQLSDENNVPAEVRLTITYIMEFVHNWYLTETVEKVVAKDGWDAVTGKRLRNEILNTKSYDCHGLGVFDYSPTRPYVGAGKVYMVKDGKALPITGIRTWPDMRPAEYKQ